MGNIHSARYSIQKNRRDANYGMSTQRRHLNILSLVKHKLSIKFGFRVKQLRQKQGISQEELAERAGVHRTYIGMIERAEKNITLTNIEKISTGLNISISKLLSGF